MKKIEIRLHHTVVAPLLDYLRKIAGPMGREDSPLLERMVELDPDMREMWESDLRHLLMEDTEHFLKIFNKEFIESGTIALDEVNAAPALRAASAFRLKLRAKDLADIPDEILERGECHYHSMSEEEKRGYSAYLFLGALQEIILEHLDLLHGTG